MSQHASADEPCACIPAVVRWRPHRTRETCGGGVLHIHMTQRRGGPEVVDQGFVRASTPRQRAAARAWWWLSPARLTRRSTPMWHMRENSLTVISRLTHANTTGLSHATSAGDVRRPGGGPSNRRLWTLIPVGPQGGSPRSPYGGPATEARKSPPARPGGGVPPRRPSCTRERGVRLSVGRGKACSGKVFDIRTPALSPRGRHDDVVGLKSPVTGGPQRSACYSSLSGPSADGSTTKVPLPTTVWTRPRSRSSRTARDAVMRAMP